MKKRLIGQLIGILVVSAALVGILAGTDVYTEVYDGIVEVLCLSCLKLDPKTQVEYTFETANGEKHPDFVLKNLTTGVVFLHYSEDACHGCDIMYPVILELFNISFEKDEMVYKKLNYGNATVHYYYTNIDHATEERAHTFQIYDKDHIGGLPMFSIITLGYDKGFIKPSYTSLYGTLNPNWSNQQRLTFLQSLMSESMELYESNKAGYSPP